MEGISSNSADEQKPAVSSADWRTQFTQLPPSFRKKTVSYINEHLKKYVDLKKLDSLPELSRRLEERTYSTATSMNDYMRIIKSKLDSMGKRFQHLGPVTPSIGTQNPLSPASMNSMPQTGRVDLVDWREEVFQKIKSMRDLYLRPLEVLRQKYESRLLQIDHQMPPANQTEENERLKNNLASIEKMITFLRVCKEDIKPHIKEKLPVIERQISGCANSIIMTGNTPNFQGQKRSQHLDLVLQQQLSRQKMHHQMPQKLEMNGLSEPIERRCFQNELGHFKNLKAGISFSIPSPQNFQISSSKMHNLSSGASPTPFGPAPILGDSEKTSLISSSSNSKDRGHISAPYAINTPGISPSALLEECTSLDDDLANVTTNKTSAQDEPLEKLIRMVQSVRPNDFRSKVRSMMSVASSIDMMSGSVCRYGSRGAIGEDLSLTTYHRLQARHLNSVSSADSIKEFDIYTSDSESATSCIKRRKSEADHTLFEEIRELNCKLISTVVVVSDVDAELLKEGMRGTVIECSLNDVFLSPSFKSQFASKGVPILSRLRIVVPTNYPEVSPLLVDQHELREGDFLTADVWSRFMRLIRCGQQPMSVEEMVRAWDASSREVIKEFAEMNGGGSLFGRWDNCMEGTRPSIC